MSVEDAFEALIERDVRFGYVDRSASGTHLLAPRVVLNGDDNSMLRVLREQLRHCSSFTFSVAFVSPRAIALIKQELVEFEGHGVIVTSDYLGFNSPRAFAELLGLSNLGIDVRIHKSRAYHPKGYVFGYPDRVEVVLGSSNLTESALVDNHEWNLRVAASRRSDLADQLAAAVGAEIAGSIPLTREWLDTYTERYVAPEPRQTSSDAAWRSETEDEAGPSGVGIELDVSHERHGGGDSGPEEAARRDAQDRAAVRREREVHPNRMQLEALIEIEQLRASGEGRGLVISATGTGKTILAALDVRAVNPRRMLFVVHREQILDKAIAEFQRVLGAHPDDFGKLAGGLRQEGRRYVFATIQTLSRPDVLSTFDPEAFDYVLIDEVHRVGGESYVRVVDHFKPRFMLGMTATPERNDDFNVFEIFDYNVPYEIRLGSALENNMLVPFHYYGVSDVTFDDGSTTSVEDGLSELTSRLRVEHVVRNLDTYTQAGLQPRGLIFCSRKDEARALSVELNRTTFRGAPLRTQALTGDDSIVEREQAVSRLEAGDLDYILTVDVFNEGIDIPSINQIVMLRQTQSSIVFVQQLGRGLRKHSGKDYIVVIDFIGNYANNYLIPIALFGNESLNKESLRQSLISAEESGVLPGISSVRFDRVSQQRVLDAIAVAKLDSLANLKRSVEMLRSRLGRMPQLRDFLRFESVDPVLLANRVGGYPALLERLFKIDSGLTSHEADALRLLSGEALDAKRPHELVLLRELLEGSTMTRQRAAEVLEAYGLPSDQRHVDSAIRSLTLDFHTQQERERYQRGIVESEGDCWSLTQAFRDSYSRSEAFRTAVDDLVHTGLAVIADRYEPIGPFTPGRQYTRKDACRLLCWPSNSASTIYGYKVDRDSAACPIFVTLHKSDAISASTAYEDELLDRHSMKWFTRSRRTLESAEVDAIVSGAVTPYVFAKKSDAEGGDFYFLGRAAPEGAHDTTMPDDAGQLLPVVAMNLHFDRPVETGVFDYFHPVVTE